MTKKCLGCGEILQTINENELGYVNEKVYEKSTLCTRCFKIKHYGEDYVVDKKEDTLDFINKINKKDIPVLYLADIITLSKETLSLYNEIKTKKYLVLTKRDLLPKSIKNTKLIEWLKNYINNVENVFIVSANKKMNIDNLYNKLMSDNINKIYLVGFTNQGKSTLVNTLLNSIGMESVVTSSILPNTTTRLVNIKLNDKLTIIDTPGLISDRLLLNYIDISEYKKLIPKKEIHPKIYHIYPGWVLIIKNFMRIENRSNKTINLVFYLNNNLEYKKCKILRDTSLMDYEKVYVKTDGNTDIVIEGVGFIKVIDDMDGVIFIKNKKAISKRVKLV